jgi:5-methyltetrahydrofolate--homocysteine methyltransferase
MSQLERKLTGGGLTSEIMSTAQVCVDSVRGADLLLGHDAWGASWIATHRARKAAAEAANAGAATAV